MGGSKPFHLDFWISLKQLYEISPVFLTPRTIPRTIIMYSHYIALPTIKCMFVSVCKVYLSRCMSTIEQKLKVVEKACSRSRDWKPPVFGGLLPAI